MDHLTINVDNPIAVKQLTVAVGDALRSIDTIAASLVWMAKLFDKVFLEGEANLGIRTVNHLLSEMNSPLIDCHFVRRLRAHMDGSAADPPPALLTETFDQS